MNVLIINPPRYNGSSVTREGRCELILNYRVDTPATLLIIAAIVKKLEFNVEFIDANGLNLSYSFLTKKLKTLNYDFFVFTFNSQIIEHDLEICKIVKEKNPLCITIGYSWYARNYSKEILDEYHFLDFLIIEDPFWIIENLIKCLINNNNLLEINGIAYRNNEKEIIINEYKSSKKRLDDLPIPAYELLKSFKPYFIYSPILRPYALVYAGKGCPFSCEYCNVANTPYSGKSVKKIIEELKFLKKIGKVRYVWFFDEVFTINRKRTIQFCNEMIKERLKIKWFCDSRVDLVDKPLLNLMRKAGCMGISYGVESGSEKILKSMNKRITIEQAKAALRWTKKAHIPVQLNLLLGYIGENQNTLRESERFIVEALPNFIQTSIFLVLESTKFIEIANKKNWININLDWKTKLTAPHKKLINYEYYNVSLWRKIDEFPKLLHKNPKWWLLSLKTIVLNPILLSVLFYSVINRQKFVGII